MGGGVPFPTLFLSCSLHGTNQPSWTNQYSNLTEHYSVHSNATKRRKLYRIITNPTRKITTSTTRGMPTHEIPFSYSGNALPSATARNRYLINNSASTSSIGQSLVSGGGLIVLQEVYTERNDTPNSEKRLRQSFLPRFRKGCSW